MHTIQTQYYHSPCGELLLGSFGEQLCLCNWATDNKSTSRVVKALRARTVETPSAVTTEAARQLDEYFCGERRAFSLPLLLVGTEFQQTVWRSLLRIPYGTTISYAEQAVMIGRPQAVRAVAAANAANALSVVVPCHRVIGSNGQLTGYAGGIAAKLFLLRTEMSQLSLLAE